MSDDQALFARAAAWAESDPDPETRGEIQALVAARDGDALAERFAGPLEFGTAGLRGVMGGGETRMNRAVIRRTTAGLAAHLLATVPDAATRGVVVGHDARKWSRELAEDTACVLAAAGVVAHLFDDLVHTPMTAYAVGKLGAAAGVMVTASHNPPEYNGYKVYGPDGAQIVPPSDVHIAARIAAAPVAKDVPILSLSDARSSSKVVPVSDAIRAQYLDEVAALSLDSRGREHLRVVYTPLHGVGDRVAHAALERFGFRDVTSVPEQREPDGRFPTVAFPNPEEKGVLSLATKLAVATNANLVLANDPDADRLAVAIPDGHGGFRQLSGNEVGVLLGEYLLRKGAQSSSRLVLTTIVSSPVLGHVARALGARYEETLTGFKWIASTAMRRERESGATFVFGYEEALGYTIGRVVRDKDGVSAACIFAELSAVLAAEGRTVREELERLARTYGLFVSTQKSLTRKGASGAAEIAGIMRHLRERAPSSVGGRKVRVVRDVDAGTETRDGTTTRIDLPRSNVLVFELEGDARVIARPSGTEPKIKLYVDLREAVREGEPFANAEARAQTALTKLADDFAALAG
jgi:phosphomannomutase